MYVWIPFTVVISRNYQVPVEDTGPRLNSILPKILTRVKRPISRFCCTFRRALARQPVAHRFSPRPSRIQSSAIDLSRSFTAVVVYAHVPFHLSCFTAFPSCCTYKTSPSWLPWGRANARREDEECLRVYGEPAHSRVTASMPFCRCINTWMYFVVWLCMFVCG